MSTSRWVSINPELAKKHRLYGASGWINFFVVMLVLWVLGGAYRLFLAFREFQLLWGMSGFNENIAIITFATNGLWIAAFAWVFFQIEKFVPKTLNIIFFVLSLSIFIPALQLLIVGLQYDLRASYVAPFVLPVFVSLCWMSYFHFSKRSNLNYRHRVKRTDPFAAEYAEEMQNMLTAEKISNAAAPHTPSVVRRFLYIKEPWLLRMWLVLQVLGIALILIQLTTTKWTFSDLFNSWRWQRRNENWFFLLYLFGPYALAKAMDWINEAKTTGKT